MISTPGSDHLLHDRAGHRGCRASETSRRRLEPHLRSSAGRAIRRRRRSCARDPEPRLRARRESRARGRATRSLVGVGDPAMRDDGDAEAVEQGRGGCRSEPRAVGLQRRARPRRSARARSTSTSVEVAAPSPAGRRRQSARSATVRVACAAVSGNANDGMVRRSPSPRERRRVRPSAQEARHERLAVPASARPDDRAATSVGARRRAAGRRWQAPRRSASSASAIRSAASNSLRGRARDQVDRVAHRCAGDGELRSASCVVASSSGTSRPAPAHASAARIPGPPALRDDGDPPARRQRLMRQHHRGRRAALRACRRG